jgi:sporulation protein YlmC with PRC-barrel domain
LHTDDRHELIGKQVVDTDGVEIGYIVDADPRFLRLAEGPIGSLGLGRRFAKHVTDKVMLGGPVSEVFSGLNVVDSSGEFVGIVRDTVESGDVLDSLIVEGEEGGMLVAVMEDISIIDEWVELRTSAEELEEKQ